MYEYIEKNQERISEVNNMDTTGRDHGKISKDFFKDVRVHYNTNCSPQLQKTVYKQINPILQKQEGLPLLCPVYVCLPEGDFKGIVIGVSKKGTQEKPESYYDVKIEDSSDRFFLKKDVVKDIEQIYVQARGRLMDTLNFISLDSFGAPTRIVSGRDTSITSKEQMHASKTPVLDNEILDKAQQTYGKSKTLDGTGVFHLGSNSGALLVRENDAYKLVGLERSNKKLKVEKGTGAFSETEAKVNFQVDQVLTTGLTGCSFIAITDDERSFLAVAHLDTGDGIKNVMSEMKEKSLIPTFIYASIIDGDGNSLEVTRVRNIAKIFKIQKIRILNRNSSDRASAYSLNVVGIDLGTGKAPAEAGKENADAIGGRPMSVFGKMGSSEDTVRQYITGWVGIWKRECKPEWKLIGKNPVKTEPIRRCLSSLNLTRFFDIVIWKLQELGNGNVYAGIENSIVVDELFKIIYPSLKEIDFSEVF